MSKKNPTFKDFRNTFHKRRKYLIDKQAEWIAHNGSELTAIRIEIAALEWATSALDLKIMERDNMANGEIVCGGVSR